MLYLYNENKIKKKNKKNKKNKRETKKTKRNKKRKTKKIKLLLLLSIFVDCLYEMPCVRNGAHCSFCVPFDESWPRYINHCAKPFNLNTQIVFLNQE
jgi:hypothetical protein